MTLRLIALAAFVAVSACAPQTSSLPSTGAPTAEATALARSTCPNADFVTVAPPDYQLVWYRC